MKMDISNKTLALLLVGAMVVSLAGTILSLNKLGEVSITGMPVQLGNVSLEVEQLLSITTEDNPAISFGSCSPDTDSVLILNSEFGENTSDSCDITEAQTPIHIRNNGNVPASVQVSPDDYGTADEVGTFLAPATNSALAYRILDEGLDGVYGGGCSSTAGSQGSAAGSLVGDYTNFTGTGDFLVCDNLADSSGANLNNSVGMHLQITFPTDVVPGNYDVVFTFTASNP